MKTAKIISVLSLSLVGLPLMGQFTIRDTPELELPTAKPKEQVIEPVAPYKWEYVNEAERIRQKKALRKQRNFLSITAKFNLSQTNFDNWAKGGDKTLAVKGELNLRHEFKKSRFSTTTRFDGRYGFSYIEKLRYKNDDWFKLELEPSWDIHKNWSYSGNVRLESQFDDGYQNQHKKNEKRNSSFMSPGTLNISGGIKFKKSGWEILASPMGGKGTFVLDGTLSKLGIGGVPKGKRQKWEAGPSLKVIYEKNFGKKLFGHEFSPTLFLIKSNLYIFSNIRFEDDPTFNWTGSFSIRPIKWLTGSINAEGIYNKGIKTPNLKPFQLKYSYSVALTYTFKNK